MKGSAARLLAGVLAALLVVGLAIGARPASAQAATEVDTPVAATGTASSQVVLIMAPFVSWNDITARTTPALWSAAENGLIANINARSRSGGQAGLLTERALSLGSGVPTMVDTSALDAYNGNEVLSGEQISAIAPSYLQTPMGANEIAFLGLPRTRIANASNNFDVSIGLLGSTIEAHGGVTAALGNSDLRRGTYAADLQRPAALLAMNGAGYVRYGDVSDDLLAKDTSAPYGVRTDQAKLAQEMAATQSAIKNSGASKSLVVIDPGDLYRAWQARSDVAPQVATRQWSEALTSLDTCYAQARKAFPQATIIMTSVATHNTKVNIDSFGPLIVSAPESSSNATAGLLISASTHRDGLVVDGDIAPSVLGMLGITTPVQMSGSPLTVDQTSARTGAVLTSRIADLTRMNATAVSVESVRAPAINWFVTATVLIILLGAFFVIFADRLFSRRFTWVCKRIMYALILFVLSLPLANWLMFFIYRWPSTPAAVLWEFLAVAFALWVILCVIAWKGNKRLPLIVLIGVTVAVIVVDQFLGAPASFTSLFGYSPIAAARFYGMGNEAAAILTGAVMIGCGLLVDQYPQARWMPYFKRYGVAVLGLLAMISAAAPMLGANAGVAIWATVGFIVLWILLNAKRVTLKSVLVMIGAVVVVVVLFILADLFLPGEGTHLGRLVLDTVNGGFIQLWIMVARKIATNLRVFAATNWAYILLAVIAYLVVLGARPTGDFAVAMKKNPAFRGAMISVLVAGIVAFCTEDSGIVLPSLMVIYLGSSIVWLMLGPIKGGTKEERLALRRVHLQQQIEALSDGEPESGK